MPLWWNPLICCPTARYFPNDIWDATVKGTERSISPAFQSNLLWEGNNMSISEGNKKKKKTDWVTPPPTLFECGLGAWNRSGSRWHWESFSIVLQKDTFPARQLLWRQLKFGGSDFILSPRQFLIGREIFSFETPVWKIDFVKKNQMKTIFAGWEIMRKYFFFFSQHQVRALLNPALDLSC